MPYILFLKGQEGGRAVKNDWPLVYFPSCKIEGGWRLMRQDDVQLIMKYTPKSWDYLEIIDPDFELSVLVNHHYYKRG